MTEKSMYGVWLTAQHYNEGQNPSLAGDANWTEVVESIVAEGSVSVDQPRLFIATQVEGVWVPETFFNARTRKRSDISEGQAKKYLSRRDKAIAALPPEPAPPAAPAEDVGSLLLRLPPPIVDLLATAFKLISEGREVTIRAEHPPKQ